jgi:putative ABC transport system ATP-binding protein
MSITHIPLLVAESLKIQRGHKNVKSILSGSSDCSFVIESGRFYYLAGASGVGKSTLLWTLARMHPLMAGTLNLLGTHHTEIVVAQWRTEVALLPQKPVIMQGTIAENLLYPLHRLRFQKERFLAQHDSLPNVEDLQKELETIGLQDISLEREAASLSGGQQARLALIRVLLTKPKLILADEPMAGVDEVSAELVFNRLHQFCEESGAVILTSHVYGERINGTRILLNDHGTLQVI